MRISASPSHCRPAATAQTRLAVRAHAAGQASRPTKSLLDGLKAGFGAAALSTLLFASGAGASVLVDEAAERELEIKAQRNQMEFVLTQQENARKALLLSQRKAVEQQVTSVETVLQQQLTQQRASALAAEKLGDKGRAESIKAQEAQLEEKAAQVRKAAVEIESRLGRAEMLQKAKALAEKQQVQKAAQVAVDDINQAIDTYLETATSVKS